MTTPLPVQNSRGKVETIQKCVDIGYDEETASSTVLLGEEVDSSIFL